jgi:hypothetical protein
VRHVVEAERHVPLLELLPAAEEADNLAVLGIAGIPYKVFGEKAGAIKKIIETISFVLLPLPTYACSM